MLFKTSDKVSVALEAATDSNIAKGSTRLSKSNLSMLYTSFGEFFNKAYTEIFADYS